MTTENIDDFIAATRNGTATSEQSHIGSEDESRGQESSEIDSANNAEGEQETESKNESKETQGEESNPYDLGDDESEESENVDDYGNEKAASKTYTQEEVDQRINEAVRERLARLEKNSPNAQQQQQMQQQAQQNFQDVYDPTSKETWQQQLQKFVEHTVTNMSAKQIEQQRRQQEQQAQSEYEQKFHSGMSKFKDFEKVVGSQPITDAMVYATRGLKDPAAFFYAAAKRSPEELERIARIPDQYAQGLELGRLEQKMRKQKATTKAPKPISKTSGDVTQKPNESRRTEVDDLIAQSNADRLARRRGRR